MVSISRKPLTRTAPRRRALPTGQVRAGRSGRGCAGRTGKAVEAISGGDLGIGSRGRYLGCCLRSRTKGGSEHFDLKRETLEQPTLFKETLTARSSGMVAWKENRCHPPLSSIPKPEVFQIPTLIQLLQLADTTDHCHQSAPTHRFQYHYLQATHDRSDLYTSPNSNKHLG